MLSPVKPALCWSPRNLNPRLEELQDDSKDWISMESCAPSEKYDKWLEAERIENEKLAQNAASYIKWLKQPLSADHFARRNRLFCIRHQAALRELAQ